MRDTVTASRLYDFITCPRRVDLDMHRPTGERADVSPFVAMLWKRGAAHERETLSELARAAFDLRGLPAQERLSATAAAMAAGADVVLGGRIEADDLVGDPDLLLREGDAYVAGDVKSGRGEDPDDGRPKPHYAVQVALYCDVLERLGLSAGRVAEIWDARGERVRYDLTQRRGPRTAESWWEFYERTRDAVRDVAAVADSTQGALAAACGLCHWRDVCKTELAEADDLTLIPALGRAARDALSPAFPTVASLASADLADHVHAGRTRFPRIGPDTLARYRERALLLSTPGASAYLRAPVDLPDTRHEIFFDIEADPLRDRTYLHGFVHRMDRDPATERFVAFTAERATSEDEGRAFAEAMAHVAAHPDATIYYYSKYERTMYRKLQARYPDACSIEAVEALFTHPRSVDLYCDVVAKATEWPIRNHSIKTIAKHLGFAWRDTDPSGAASIEWYDRWLSTGDRAVLDRIVAYNEDDCRATAVVLDGVRALALRP